MAGGTDHGLSGAAASRPPGGVGLARGATRGRTLAEAFSPRHNSLAMMRLGLAGMVAVAHAFGIGYGREPVLGVTALADFAVDGFFVLSGFLVTRSYLRLDSAGRYTWHRFLRIMPGFWVCLVVTAVVFAPLAAVLVGRSPASVFSVEQDPAWSYVLVNAALPILQYEIAGIAGPTGERVFDGSLWTLQYEAFCYGVLAVLGVAAVLRRRRWVVPALCIAVWAAAVADARGLIPVDVPVFDNRNMLRFLLLFLLGAAGCLFAERLPIRWTWALVSGILVVACSFLSDYRLVAAACFAYLCLYGMVRLPVRWTPAWDLSYGLYVYHWPIQFLLLLAGATTMGEWPFAVVTVGLALAAAVLSWVFVEGPALGLKDARWPRGSRGRSRSAA